MSKVLPTPAKRHLPSKEAGLFKELLTLYETRQLKKGLKTADQILKKFPEHGETLSMKGLVLTHMGRRDEGLDMVKKGVRLDLTSHICWHVFGLIQKGEKNYEEALKSYTQALRFDKDNMNILRDAAHLQTQLRLFDSLVETRHTILKLRPTLRQHWIALAVAYHLNGNLPEARKTLEHYESMLKNVPDHDVEQSETLLYHIRLLEEMGENSEALALLDNNSKSRAIVDRLAAMEVRARLLTTLKSDDAETAWQALLEYNSDCYEYYKGFLANRGIAIDSPSALPILRNFVEQMPKASTPRRLALSIASGDDFRDLVKPYLLTGLKKGIPSLFVDVKGLYEDDSKRKIIEEIVEAARTEYATEVPPTPENDSDPTVYVWTLYFLAQHYSFLCQTVKAIEIVNVAIEHTPTLPELYTCKGRIYKRAGDPYHAVQSVNEARLLDGQDRFLNTKCGKYLLRAGFITEASAVLGLFTKKDAVSPGQDLEDMQSLLYLVEEADAHNRNGKPNLALKKYLAISKVFGEIEDDQYDFHGYNLRKFTINSYLNMVKWEDKLRSHPSYVKTALEASRIYVAVHDDPSIVTAITSTGPLSDAEKKAKKKAKKAAQKEKAQEDTKKGSAQAANEDKGLEAPSPKDEDPDGIKLLSVSDPLEQAAKLLAQLPDLAGENIDVWIAVYDVAVRRRKLLQAARALSRARSLNADYPELHIRLVHFQKTISALPQEPPAPIGPALSEARAEPFPEEVGLETYNSQYLQKHSNSASAVLAAAKVLHLLQAPLQEVESTIFTSFENGTTLDLDTALSTVSFLKSIKAPRVEDFRKACAERFTQSAVFKPEPEIDALKKLVMSNEEEVVNDEAELQ